MSLNFLKWDLTLAHWTQVRDCCPLGYLLIKKVLNEPPHDKATKWPERPVKTQISLGIHPVWSEFSLSEWRKLGSLATHSPHSKDWSDWWMPRLIWVFAGRTGHFDGFVMRKLKWQWSGTCRNNIKWEIFKDWNHYFEVSLCDEKHWLSLMFVKPKGLLIYITLS